MNLISKKPALPSGIEGDPRAQALLERLKPERMPRHVAIIMDGNGRWARGRGLERTRGHRAAIESVRAATRTSRQLGIAALTLYSFSKENWRRPGAEVATLMRLLERFLIGERPEMMDNDIRLVASGALEDLPSYARKALEESMAQTAGNGSMTLNLALSYGGRAEIVQAARRFAEEVAAGRAKPEELDESRFGKYLYHPELDDPDLMIRTSGEMRISNFLLWQLAYTEIYVTPTLWPDFGRVDFLEALADYQKRERRFGAVG